MADVDGKALPAELITTGKIDVTSVTSGDQFRAMCDALRNAAQDYSRVGGSSIPEG